MSRHSVYWMVAMARTRSRDQFCIAQSQISDNVLCASVVGGGAA